MSQNISLKEELYLLIKENNNLSSSLSSLKSKLSLLNSTLQYYKKIANLNLTSLESNESYNSKVKVNIVAVREVPVDWFEYKYEGVLMEANVQLQKGEGRILINTKPKIGIDLQSSLNVAKYVAERFTNESLKNTDIIVEVTGNKEVNVVDGPSAGSMLTIALILALENKTIVKKFSGTGTIDLNGNIGEIGGLIEKAEAVAKANISYFFVPKSQEYVYVEVPIKKNIGRNFIYITYTYEKVKLQDYLKSKGYNLTVIGVESVSDFYNKLVKNGIIK